MARRQLSSSLCSAISKSQRAGTTVWIEALQVDDDRRERLGGQIDCERRERLRRK